MLLALLLMTGCLGQRLQAPDESESRPDRGAAWTPPRPRLTPAGSRPSEPRRRKRTGPTPAVDAERLAADPAATPAMIIRTGQASLEVDSLELAVARVRQLAQPGRWLHRQ